MYLAYADCHLKQLTIKNLFMPGLKSPWSISYKLIPLKFILIRREL